MITRLSSAEETTGWGESLARELRAGDVIALCGTLGAGKTQATKGIARGLGSKAEVTSPTFTLVHEYRDARLVVFHFDFYRIEQPGELISLGWDDFLDEGGVVVVEWADRFPELMPGKTRWFWFEMPPEGGRSVREGGAPV